MCRFSQKKTFVVLFFLLAFVSFSDAMLIWDGDASKGASVWTLLNYESSTDGAAALGTITVVNDATYGPVWKFWKPATDHRTESHGARGFTAKEGDDIYIGWRMKAVCPAETQTNAFFQWKAYGTVDADGVTRAMDQNYPEIFSTQNGQFQFLYFAPGKIRNDVWNTPFVPNQWMEIVLKLKVSRDPTVGFVEIWINGVSQTLLNGKKRFYLSSLDAGWCDPKWGVYGGDGIDITNYVSAPKIATTYAEASPSGGTVTIPAAPDGLIASAVSGSQIDLSWADSDEENFVIEHSTDGATWSVLTTVAANTTRYSNTGLTASTTYYYRVMATNSVGNSAYSNVASASTTNGAASTNISLNKTATASNVYSTSYPASYAVDGSATTRWSTTDGTASGWLEVDLGAEYVFNKVITTEYQSRIASYSIQYWDGASWLDAFTGTTIGATAKTDNFAAVTARKVRLNFLSVTGTKGPSIYDFSVWGYLKSDPASLVEASESIESVIAPNPVSDFAKITYVLNKPTKVKVSIYGSNGVLIKTLVNTTHVAGVYSEDWDASAVSAGVYFVRFEVGDKMKTAKILVEKSMPSD